MSTKRDQIEKIVIVIVTAIVSVALGAAWVVSEIPDQKVESFGDSCVPIYYSGLECCKK